MITPVQAGPDLYRKVESFMRVRTRTLMKYDWWIAGNQAGVAPSEWEMIEYGRETALAYALNGTGITDSIGRGFSAIYSFAYAELKDSIGRTAGAKVTNQTSVVEVYTYPLSVSDTLHYDWLDWVARSGLLPQQKFLVVMYSLGWPVSKIAAEMNWPVRTSQRMFKQALPILKESM